MKSAEFAVALMHHTENFRLRKMGTSFEASVSNEQPLAEKTRMLSSLLRTSFETDATKQRYPFFKAWNKRGVSKVVSKQKAYLMSEFRFHCLSLN